MASGDDPGEEAPGGGVVVPISETGTAEVTEKVAKLDSALIGIVETADDVSDGLKKAFSPDNARELSELLAKVFTQITDIKATLISGAGLDAGTFGANAIRDMAKQLNQFRSTLKTLQQEFRQLPAEDGIRQNAASKLSDQRADQNVFRATEVNLDATMKLFQQRMEAALMRSLEVVAAAASTRNFERVTKDTGTQLQQTAMSVNPDVIRYRRQGVDPSSTDVTQLTAMKAALDLNGAEASQARENDLVAIYAKELVEVERQLKAVTAAEVARAKLSAEWGKEQGALNAFLGVSGKPASSAKSSAAVFRDQFATQAPLEKVEANNRVTEALTGAYGEGSLKAAQAQLSAAKANLKILADANLEYAEQQRLVESLTTKVVQLGKAQQKGGETVQDRFQRHSSNMSDYMVFGTMFAGIEESVRSVVELDKSFGELQALTQASNSQMLSLKNTINDVAQASNQSAKDIVEATIILGKFGFTATQTQESLKGIVNFASAIRMKPSEAATMLTGVVGAYDLPSTSTGAVADLATSTLAKSRLTPEAMKSGLSMTAEVGSEANVSLKELLGTMALAADAGARMTDRFGIGLRQAMISMTNPTKDFRDELAQVGLNSEAVDLKSNGLIGAFKNMHEAGFNAAQAMKVFGAEGAALYNALGKNIEGADAFIASMGQTGAATDAAKRNLDTLSGSFERFGNVWSTTLEKGSAPFAEFLKSTANAASGILSLTNTFPSLTAVVVTAAGAFATFKIASFTMELLGVAKGIAGVAGLFRGLLGPIGLASVAVGLLAGGFAALSDHFPTLAQKIDALKGQISGLKAEAESSEKTIRTIDEAILKVASEGDSLKNPIQSIRDLNEQFGALGLNISGSTSKTADLITKLEELRRNTINTIVVKIQQQEIAVGEKAQLDAAQFGSDALTAGQKVYKAADTLDDSDKFKNQLTLVAALLKSSRPSDLGTTNAIGQRGELLGSEAREFSGELADRMAKGNISDTDVKALKVTIENLQSVSGKLVALANVPSEQAALRLSSDQIKAGQPVSANATKVQADYETAQAKDTTVADKHLVGSRAEVELSQRRLALFDSIVGGTIADLDATVKKQEGQKDKTLDYPASVKALGDLRAARQKLQDRANTYAAEEFTQDQPSTNRQISTDQTAMSDKTGTMGKAKTTDDVNKLKAEVDKLAHDIFNKKMAEIAADPQYNPTIHKGINPDLRGTAEDQARGQLAASLGSNDRTSKTNLERLNTAGMAVAQQEAQAQASNLKGQIDNLFKTIAEPFTSNKDAKAAIEKLKSLIPAYLKDQTHLMEIELQQHKGTPTEQTNRKQAVATEGSNLNLQLTAAEKKANAGATWTQDNTADNTKLATAQTEYEQRNYAANKVVADAELAMAKLRASGGHPPAGESGQDVKNKMLTDQNNALLASLQTYIDDLNATIAQVTAQVAARKKILDASGYDANATEHTKDQNDALKDYNEALAKSAAINKTITAENTKQTALLKEQEKIKESAPPTSMGDAMQKGVINYHNQLGTGGMLGSLQSGTTQVLGSTQTAFASFITSFTSGTMKAKNAFRSLATSILQSMQQVLSNAIAKQFMSLATDGLGSLSSVFGGSSASATSDTASSGTSAVYTSMADVGDVFEWHGGKIPAHFWHGGRIPGGNDNVSASLWHGGKIGDHFRRAASGYDGDGSSSVSTRDSVPILAAPGEFVMRQSAVDLIGADKLSALNAMGNSTVSQSSKSVSSARQSSSNTTPHQTNVYVVNKDQQPAGLGPSDVIAAWSQDVMTGGASKKLIKSVMSGAV
ncbi:phage tail tape measure protein [Telmatospirillum sp.]|uniref:phage tail tape measure protein n=1 Tax=Telmatospirillum sp. TaxID=2079197 RepID=UPI002851B350|nr:phage tail tape measure protein [Telmatospirillum sp.]MDR3436437.1 phage tail tape measure protein [Telmatospirillum sp.]